MGKIGGEAEGPGAFFRVSREAMKADSLGRLYVLDQGDRAVTRWRQAATAVMLGLLVNCVHQRTGPVRISDTQLADSVIRRCLAPQADRQAIVADNEPSVAANGKDAKHLVAAWQTQGGGRSVVQSAVSHDGGATWSGPRAVPINACAGGPVAEAGRASDPWVSIGPDGRTYVAGIAWEPDPDGGPDLQSAVVVATSTDGGLTWGPARVAARGVSARVWHDNVAVTADPTRPHTVHLVTTRYDETDARARYGPVGYTVSRDGGTTWEPIRTITPEVDRSRISAPGIVADPRTGVLYLVYYRVEPPERVVGVRRSDDGGMTWTAEMTVTPHTRGVRPQLDPLEGRERPLADDIIRAAVSPETGTVFLTFADARREPGGRIGVYMTWSADGRTWASPVAVSDDSAETAWLPAVAASGSEVGVVYLSARLDRSRTGMAPVTVELRRYRLVGDILVFARADTVDRANYAWPGDYQGLVASGRSFVAVYGRSTLGATEPFPAPEDDPRRTDPSDIFAAVIR